MIATKAAWSTKRALLNLLITTITWQRFFIKSPFSIPRFTYSSLCRSNSMIIIGVFILCAHPRSPTTAFFTKLDITLLAVNMASLPVVTLLYYFALISSFCGISLSLNECVISYLIRSYTKPKKRLSQARIFIFLQIRSLLSSAYRSDFWTGAFQVGLISKNGDVLI